MGYRTTYVPSFMVNTKWFDAKGKWNFTKNSERAM